jgi:N-formylmaleamate deformylase
MAVSRRHFIVVIPLLIGAAAVSFSAAEPTSFRVQVSGRGRPIIFIPGLNSSGETWDATVARYRDRFESHVLTLAGFAGVPPINSPLLATVRTQLASYIRSRGLDDPIIVGHSLGGTLALALGIDHPDLVGPLVIVDGLPFLAGPSMQVKTVAEARPAVARMEAYAATLTDEQFVTMAKSGASTRYMVTSDADAATLVRWSMASDRQTMFRALAEVYSTDLREDISKIASPVLVLGTWRGIHDQLVKAKIDIPREGFVATFRDQFAKRPRLHFAMHDSARHFIMWDDPAWFHGELDSFFADPSARVRERGF